jgi:predicted exporter
MHGETDDAPHPGLLARLLCAATVVSSRRPAVTLLIVLLTTALSLGITARFLKFKTSRADLFDPKAEFQQRWLEYTDKFGEQADLVVVLEGSDPAAIRAAMDDLGSRLLAEPQTFDRVTWKFDPTGLRRKGLQYLSPRELEEGLTRLETYAPILAGHWDRAGLESYCRRLTTHIDSARQQGDAATVDSALWQAALLSTSLTQFAHTLSAGGGAGGERRVEELNDAAGGAVARSVNVDLRHSFISPWPEIFPGVGERLQGFEEARYQLSTDKTMGFILADPVNKQQDFAGTSPSIARLRTLAAETSARHPGVTVSLTGIPVLESDEMQRSQQDMSLATIISFAGVALLMLLGFRGVRHPILGNLMLAVGMAWALGYATVAVGHLNILSSSFGAILIGIGIDFAIIYLTRYIELRHQGIGLDAALVRTSAGVGTGIVTASVTGAAAFFCATFTSFLGVAELGLIAAGGILLCSAATFIVLPPLVKLADRRVEAKRFATPFQGALMRRTTSRYPWLVAGGAVATIAIVTAGAFELRDGQPAFRVSYDANLLNMQAEGTESVEVQQRVFEKSNGSLLYAVSLTDSPAEARRQAARFAALPTVGRVEEFGSAMPQYPAEETALLVQAFRARLAALSGLPRELPQIDPLTIGQALEGLLRVLSAAPVDECRVAAGRLDVFLTMLEQMPLEQQMQFLGGYQRAMLTALQMQFQQIAAAADPEPVIAGDIDSGLRQRFVSPRGDWLLRIYPRDEVWEEEPLAAFVADVRSVDPNATGTPIQNYEGARQIRESYYEAALYALAIVCLILLIDSLETRARWIALIAPLIVAVFAALTLRAPGVAVDPLTVLGLYVATAVAVAAVFDIRNVCNMFLSLLPPVCGMGLTFGVLGIAGVDLNPANLIILPLILGIGVDVGVHVVHDYRSQAGRYETSPSTINGIMMVSTTTMVGFGAMMVSAHQGLASLGLVLTIGMGASLFVGLVTLPAILTLISRYSHQEPVPAAVASVPAPRLSIVSAPRDTPPKSPGAEEPRLLPFPVPQSKPGGITVRRAKAS